MVKFFGKGSFSSIVIGFASAIVVDVLLNEKVLSGIKKGFVSSKGFLKQICRNGSDAYIKGRDHFR